MKDIKRLMGLTVAALVFTSAAHAIGGDPTMMDGPRRRRPAFLRQLFLPALIMQHQSEIELTDVQREAITAELVDTQKRALDLRWQLEAKSAALGKLLDADRVDEAAALGQIDEVMKLEDQMKRAHLTLLIRVKNLLTPAQQATLRRLQPRRTGRSRGPGPGAPPAAEVPGP